MKSYLKFLIFILCLSGGFFGAGLFSRALAVDCKAEINFDVSPKQVDINKPITITGWVRSTQYNSKGSTVLGLADGLCNTGLLSSPVNQFLVFVTNNKAANDIIRSPANPINSLSWFYNSFNSIITGHIGSDYGRYQLIALNQYDNSTKYPIGPWAIQPTNFFSGNYKPGESITFYATVIATGGGMGEVLTAASPVTIQIKNQTYACIAGDGKYACSPSIKSNLSDVPNNACVGKTAEIIDSSLCGKGKLIYACIAGNSKYACSPGNKSDLSDVPNSACAGKQAVQISSDQCGATAQASSGAGSGAAGTDATGSGAGGGMQSQNTQTLYNPIKNADTLLHLLLKIMQGFLMIIAVWAVVFIVIGGFKLVISQGNEEAVTAAKKTITWAVLGVVIAMLAFSLIAIIQNLIGIDIKEVKTSQNNNFNQTQKL